MRTAKVTARDAATIDVVLATGVVQCVISGYKVKGVPLAQDGWMDQDGDSLSGTRAPSNYRDYEFTRGATQTAGPKRRLHSSRGIKRRPHTRRIRTIHSQKARIESIRCALREPTRHLAPAFAIYVLRSASYVDGAIDARVPRQDRRCVTDTEVRRVQRMSRTEVPDKRYNLNILAMYECGMFGTCVRAHRRLRTIDSDIYTALGNVFCRRNRTAERDIRRHDPLLEPSTGMMRTSKNKSLTALRHFGARFFALGHPN